MMFKSDAQRARVCQALARAARQDALVTASGPTKAFFDEVEAPSCSAGEWVLLQVAHAVWSGSRIAGPTMGLVLLVLDEKNITLIGELLQALGAPTDHQLEAWLSAAGFPSVAP